MLSMLLLLTGAPQAAEAPVQTLRAPTIAELIGAGAVPVPPPASSVDGNAVGTPVLSDVGVNCTTRPTPASDPTAPGNGLMWREGGDAVGLYRLLDRRVDGCPDPVVVNYRVPGSNAVGREAGRAPAPSPVIVRRP